MKKDLAPALSKAVTLCPRACTASGWESGVLVPPGDAEALTAALDQLLSDPGQRRAMGAAGRAMVEAEYSIHSEAARLSSLFTAYVAGEPSPPKREVLE